MRLLNLKSLAVVATVLTALTMNSLAIAKGGELKFDSSIQSVTQTDEANGSVTIAINGIDVPVLVNADTEIRSAGNEVVLAELMAGDFVQVNAFFAEDGLTAEEITVLQMRAEHFRFRGRLTDIELAAMETEEGTYTRLQLLGTDVYVNSDTKITQRGFGFGNEVPVANLNPGMLLDLYGHHEDMLVAKRIHVGSRHAGHIELDGEVTTIVDDNNLTIMVAAGGEVPVVITEDTAVSGTIETGVLIEVEGMLNQDLAVVASEIVVDSDNDGDADDDHRRWVPGLDFPGNVLRRFSATLDAVDPEASINGSIRIEFPPVKEELQLKIHDAAATTTYMVHALVGETLVDLGTVTTDAEGEAEMEIEFGEDGVADLPEDTSPMDISEVEISLEGTVVLQGSF